MDKELLQKVKDLSKEFSKQTAFRGSIADDRLRPLKEQCFQEGAKQLYELLKLRLGNWIDQVCVNMAMEVADGVFANVPIPEDWVIKDIGNMPKMGIMMPGAGIIATLDTGTKELTIPLVDTLPEWETPGYTRTIKPLVVEGEPSETDMNWQDIAVFPLVFDDSGVPIFTENITAPNPERSVATDVKPEKKTPASKRKPKGK